MKPYRLPYFPALLLLLTIPAFPQERSAGEEAFHQARQFVAERQYDKALRAYKDANKQAKATCAPCYLGMAFVYTRMHDPKAALENSEKALKFANDDLTRAQAHNARGDALVALAGEQGGKLAEAEAEFHQALQLAPDNPEFHLRLGIVLAKQMRDEEAIAEFKQSLALELHGEVADLARTLIANPRRAREPFAPDFHIEILDGEHISLSSLAGKVVVLDFWATWCAPCRSAVPEMKELLKKYGRDQLAVISLSWNKDDNAWRDYISKHEMNWMQARDAESKISDSFGVQAVPTYIVIDGDGFIKERIVGVNPQQSLAYRLRDKLQSMPQLAKK